MTILRPTGSLRPDPSQLFPRNPTQSAPRARNQLTHRLRSPPSCPSSPSHRSSTQVQLRAPSPFLPPPLIPHQTHQVSSAIERLLRGRKGIEHSHDAEDIFTRRALLQLQDIHPSKAIRRATNWKNLLDGKSTFC